MRWNKLTVLINLIVPLFFAISSCTPVDLTNPKTTYSRRDIVMSGAQENPINPSSAIGRLNVSYSKATKILSYDFTWSGLTGPTSAGHIHGLAPMGFNAGVAQGFSGFAAATSGTYSGSLQIDGVKIKEDDILNGLYYVNIHTATYPGGEIRGQILFN